MKKYLLAGIFFVLLILTTTSEAQTKSDFFVGKWNVLVTGTPSGDAMMIVAFERKDGKLTGTIKLGNEAQPVPLSDIQEKESSVIFYFTASDYNVNISLDKKGDNKAAGFLMDQFEAKAERIIPETTAPEIKDEKVDYFTGKWNLIVAGTPNGDVKMVLTLQRKDGKLSGDIDIIDYDAVAITKAEEADSTVTVYFTAADHDLYITLTRKDDNHVEGSEMAMFDVKGERAVR